MKSLTNHNIRRNSPFYNHVNVFNTSAQGGVRHKSDKVFDQQEQLKKDLSTADVSETKTEVNEVASRASLELSEDEKKERQRKEYFRQAQAKYLAKLALPENEEKLQNQLESARKAGAKYKATLTLPGNEEKLQKHKEAGRRGNAKRAASLLLPGNEKALEKHREYVRLSSQIRWDKLHQPGNEAALQKYKESSAKANQSRLEVLREKKLAQETVAALRSDDLDPEDPKS